MSEHLSVGKWGEDVARKYLITQGYTILAENWRMRHLEVDLIAMKDNYVAFIEVKTRTSVDDDPVLAVDKKKINKIIRAANVYMQINRLPHYTRFDIFSVTGTPDNYTFEHLIDAFYPQVRSYR